MQFETTTLWAYDLEKAVWAKLTTEGDTMATRGKRLAYFDPALNVLVVTDGMTAWAYRSKAT